MPVTWVTRPGCVTAPLAWPVAAPPAAVDLASPAWQNRATAATAATRPASAGSDQAGLGPKPRKCAIVPNDPWRPVSHEISGGAASIARASPAVSVAAQLTSVARLAPRSRSSGFSDAHQRAGPRRRPPAGASVSHQYPNSASVSPAAITGGSHQARPVTAAVIACPAGTSTPSPRSSQPQAWATAYSGASTRMKVTIAPRSSDRTPTSTVAALGAM